VLAITTGLNDAQASALAKAISVGGVEGATMAESLAAVPTMPADTVAALLVLAAWFRSKKSEPKREGEVVTRPLPTPGDEEEQAFISRCMASEVMQAEYPEQEQRAAVCYSQWRKAHEGREATSARSAGPAIILRPAPAGVKLSDAGEISGHAATWDYDGDGIRFTKGCFARSLAERMGKIPLVLKHTREGTSVLDTVGWLVAGEEDEKGLYVETRFLDTPVAQAIREQARAGGAFAFSVQAEVVRGHKNGQVIVADEARLIDIVVTNVPADPAAVITSVREGAGSPPATPIVKPPLQGTPLCPGARVPAEDRLRRETLLKLLEIEDAP
jgi:HK97 family phage prohead protease